ncbi:hypothetical protein AVEN_107492-1 [Araneus ventricosus]|uniref:Uncharacterized protein n=1 Tax=Araneus ventricosus TaxID=182803 RepID=A0A4Y2S3I8_ARAVE|nr:hypothetical protein AVEN_107492-1 [Araneus ventricosus]
MQQPLVSAVVRIRHKIPPALAVINLCIYISNHLPLKSGQPKPSALAGGQAMELFNSLPMQSGQSKPSALAGWMHSVLIVANEASVIGGTRPSLHIMPMAK